MSGDMGQSRHIGSACSSTLQNGGHLGHGASCNRSSLRLLMTYVCPSRPFCPSMSDSLLLPQSQHVFCLLGQAQVSYTCCSQTQPQKSLCPIFAFFFFMTRLFTFYDILTYHVFDLQFICVFSVSTHRMSFHNGKMSVSFSGVHQQLAQYPA